MAAPLSATPAAPWTPDDLVLAQEAEGWALSPDGRAAVWARSVVEKVEGEEKRVANLWLARPVGDDEEPERLALTRGRDTVSSPAFSPDGRHVAFLSTRPIPGAGEGEGPEGKPGEEQLWVIPVDGGEARPVTRFDRDVLHFGWRDAERLVVAAEESPSAWERERKKLKDTAVVVEDAERKPPVRLFEVSIREGGGAATPRRLTRDRDWIDSLAVSPDGRHAVVTAQQSLSYSFDQKVPPATFLVELDSGERARLFDGTSLVPFAVAWSADSSGFYLANSYSSHPRYRTAAITELHYHDLERGETTRVDLGWERGLGGAYAVTADGFLALLADGVRRRPARYVRRGDDPVWERRDLTGAHGEHIDHWITSRDGRAVVYRHSTATTPPQWYGARLAGDRLAGERRLTDLNPGFRDKPTGRVEVLRWRGARGDEVEGLLHYPLDWPPEDGAEAPAPRPLIVDIHGGPSSADRDSWDQRWSGPLLLLRQRGAFVLQVNYHGSSGYGLEWVESIRERYYELEIPDIEAGVEHVVARGLADRRRLGILGWSNGGILGAELLTRDSGYRAASIGAADVEWISDWANVDFGAAFDNYYFGGPPWEKLTTYIEKSPFFRLTEVATPTLIHTGTKDRNVPPHQSWSLFRALQQIGKTPARLVLYPDQPHGLRKIAHQRRKIEEDLAWFDRHLFGSAAEERGAVRDGSPLQALLQSAGAARHGGRYGQLEAGVLVPETVPVAGLGVSPDDVPGGLEVGRFEVTRAQFAAFAPDFPVPPGTENHPAAGVPFERARAYADWLAGVTGRPFRLPTAAEAEKLAAAGGDGGNTLEHWAGYSPNPEDVEALARALSEMSETAGAAATAPLLRPAGSHPGRGSDPVFDLDGNAAEWAVGEDGTGVPAGPSADRPRDPRHRSGTPADPAYIGLRVVVEAGEP